MSSHEQLSPARRRDVVHPHQWRLPRGQPVIDHLEARTPGVVGVDLRVVGGRHVHGVAVEPDALRAPELRGTGHLVARGAAPAGGIGHLGPLDRAVAGHLRQLQQAFLEPGPPARGEAIERSILQILGEVDPPATRVHRGGLVLEDPHRVVHARGAPPRRIALPDAPLLYLLAGEPRAPGRGPAGAVLRSAVEDPVGVAYLPVRAEAQRAGSPFEVLAVGHQDPAAVTGREGRGAVGGDVPAVVAAGHDLLAPRNAPGPEAIRQADAVRVRGAHRTVPRATRRRTGARHGRVAGERTPPERGAECQAGGRSHPCLHELAAAVGVIAHGTSR